jgi:A/G-specific adenine glycosylase
MRICKARQAGTQEQRPVLKPKKRLPHFVQVAAVIVKRDRLLLAKRPSKGLLGGMWEFPNARVVPKTGVEISPEKELERVLSKAYPFKVRRKEALSIIQHAYTHFSLTIYPFICKLVTDSKIKNLRWVRIEDLDKYPMGRIDRQIAIQIQSRGLNK